MIKLKNVGDISSLGVCSPLSETKIWECDIEAITHKTVRLAYERVKLNHGSSVAHECFSVSQNETIKAQMFGDIGRNEFSTFRLPESPTLFSDVLRTLEKFTIGEKRAIIYAIANEIHIRQAANLLWGEQPSSVSPFITNLLRILPRHITCRNLFWRYNEDGSVEPLKGIESKFMSKTGKTWGDFVKSTDRIVLATCEPELEINSALL